MHPKDALGRYGEAVAARCLTDAGYTVLAQNWRCSQGELDIVAVDGRTLIVCEVKTRSSTAFGDPAEAVGEAKVRRIRLLTREWLIEHPGTWNAIRFDVVAVLRPRTGPAQVRHLQGAF